MVNETVTELCPNCMTENELEYRFEPQQCNECKELILPCSQCLLESCKECPMEDMREDMVNSK